MLDWIVPSHVAACAYPRVDADWQAISEAGIDLIVNLHERAHAADVLLAHRVREVHLPVVDFTPPTPEQLVVGVAAIRSAVANDQKVLVHCGGGLGRTGTLVACYLVDTGLAADDAIAQVRRSRPGSIETKAQEQAIHAFAGCS
jgi:atypical dual specificity phosphatase